MAPAHQNKRPYAGNQPSITSYFQPSISPTSTAQPNYSIIPQSTYPPSRVELPAKVQADLLSVGMRVRKSVPEGYKTRSSQSNFAVYSDSAPATPMEQQRAEARFNRPRARELTPWCGILKTGGLAQQGYGSRMDSPDDDCMEEDVPALSQSSTISNNSVSTPRGERKRTMDFDEEDREDAAPFAFSFSPHMPSSNFTSERTMAIPRGRKAKSNLTVIGQENVDSDADFEDAEFLDYGLLGDSEMGGV